MGNYLPPIPFIGERGVKRKSIDDDDDNDDYPTAPKRRKLATTSSYIFKTLFQEGQNSDITISALGKSWNLHRVYLCQSDYFASMFGGAWRESNAREVQIEINNPNITTDALHLVFGSFYQDEIIIDPELVVEIMATANLFQLQTVINQTKEILSSSISCDNVVRYHDVTFEHGYVDITEQCFHWLELNLLGCISHETEKIREVGQELMTRLLSSRELYVNQSEFSTYAIAKLWLYLQKHPHWTGYKDECIAAAHRYFRDQPEGYFLESQEGIEFEPVFRTLRLQYLITQRFDNEMLEQDRIIPKKWLEAVYQAQWHRVLRVEDGADKGPKNLPPDVFYDNCCRCGRTLLSDEFHNWRWAGYNFGLDITVSYERKTLRFRRNHRHSPEYQSSLSVIPRRQLMCRITATSIGNRRQPTFTSTTGIMNYSLGKNEEIQVMKIPDTATFPILLSANFLFVSPSTARGAKKFEVIDFT